jgi:CBS-domain-containing membrane protein
MPAEPTPLPLVIRRPLIALRTFDSVAVALDVAREHGVHHFPVCEHERVVGMVCTCDLQNAGPERLVGEVMRPAVSLPANRSAADVALLMRAADVGSVLITDRRGAACGIVTRSDLNGDPPVAALLEDCRCEICGAVRHLHGYQGRQLCFSCHQRVSEPPPSTTRTRHGA